MVNLGAIGNLLIAYSETVVGSKRGVFAFLHGSGDRLPFAPCELVDVSTAWGRPSCSSSRAYVTDLALAVSGDLTVLRARLEGGAWTGAPPAR